LDEEQPKQKTKKKTKSGHQDQDAPAPAPTDSSRPASGREGKSSKKSKHRRHTSTEAEAGPDHSIFEDDGHASTTKEPPHGIQNPLDRQEHEHEHSASRKTKEKKKSKHLHETTDSQDEVAHRATVMDDPIHGVVTGADGEVKGKPKKRTKPSISHETTEGESGKKRKKHEKSKRDGVRVDKHEVSPAINDAAPAEVEVPAPQEVKKKEHRKKKKERSAVRVPDGLPGAEPGNTEPRLRMTSPSKPRGVTKPSSAPANPDFPFFTQTVSLYLPLYPKGFDKPISSAIDQYFKPSLGHYSPMFGGVLLGFQNVAVGPPERPDPKNLPTDETPALLETIESYAVGYAYVTADVDLFVPRRGAWMEGKVILQSEGHLGVLCWDRFNASIEAKRLPRGWEFIDLAQQADGAKPSVSHDAASPSLHQQNDADADIGDLPIVEQMHGTGYWVDGAKRRVKGQLMFRIKNFEVGTAGDDYGYLSITGTMLSPEEEARAAAEEMEAEKRRNVRMSNSLLRREARRVPEFSVTRLGKEDQEEDSSQRQELYKGSRPGTPDD